MLLVDGHTLLSRNDNGSPRIHELALHRLLAAVVLTTIDTAARAPNARGGHRSNVADPADEAVRRLVRKRRFVVAVGASATGAIG